MLGSPLSGWWDSIRALSVQAAEASVPDTGHLQFLEKRIETEFLPNHWSHSVDH